MKNRRQFLKESALLAGAAAGAPSLARSASTVVMPKGKAEHCIFIWLGGGMAQIDTFDPKRKGDSKAKPKKSGSEYDNHFFRIPAPA